MDYDRDKRVCPACGYVDMQEPGLHILAVFEGQDASGGMMGGCSCTRCDSRWSEVDYPTATFITINHKGEVPADD